MLPVGDKVTSYCRLVRFSTGTFVNVTQLVVVRSKFCCMTSFVEGMGQENARLWLDALRFSCGVGANCNV